MKKRKLFSDILVEEAVVSAAEMVTLMVAARQQVTSLTNLLVKQGQAPRHLLTRILQKRKFDILLGDLLVETGLVHPEQMAYALRQQEQSGNSLGEELHQLGLASRDTVFSMLCQQLGMITIIPEVKLAQKINPMLPDKFILSNLVFPYFETEGQLTCLMADPFNNETIHHLQKIYHQMVLKVAYTPEPVLIEFLENRYAAMTSSLGSEEKPSVAMNDFDLQPDVMAGETMPLTLSDDNQDHARQIVRFYIKKAIENQASDLHFEPLRDALRLRFSINGTLQVVTHFPKDIAAGVVVAVKAMATMDVASQRRPDDGRMSVHYQQYQYALRVSTYPCYYGENCVIRLLRQDAELNTLDAIGFSAHNFYKLKKNLLSSSGITLVTGPTGSGKSTSLYCILQQLLVDEKHIITVEDPIEYVINGVTQAAVNKKAGLSYDTALPAIMRQNPDVIMVGETRDQETAGAIVQAALTGHKVLTTLHTETAIGTLNRLLQMGIEPYLLADTVELVIAQRLARRPCPHCLVQAVANADLLQQLQISAKEVVGYSFQVGSGRKGNLDCDYCRGTGFLGRVALHEVLPVDIEIVQAIAAGKSSGEVYEIARRQHGVTSLREDAIYKALKGMTTLEECLRVTPETGEKPRSLAAIVALSERDGEVTPCEHTVSAWGEAPLPLSFPILMGDAFEKPIDKQLRVELEAVGIAVKMVKSFTLGDPQLSPAVLAQVRKVYWDRTLQCSERVPDNRQCNGCHQQTRKILPILEAHNHELPAVVFVGDGEYQYFFAHLIVKEQESWKLVSRSC